MLSRLASSKLTLFGMVLLFIGAILSYGSILDVSMWVLVVPMAIMAINLLAAIATNRKINRQPGLLIFHLGLLGVVLLAALGRLTHLDAQVEIVQGNPFDPSLLNEIKKGPLHPWNFDKINFVQGPYTISYSAQLQRGLTETTIYYQDEQGRQKSFTFGDDVPYEIHNYKFYSSFNKGFAPILTWTPVGGAPITGSVNMPSFPLYDYKQKNSWTPPGEKDPVELWLKLATQYNQEGNWVLSKETSSAILAVTYKDKRVELKPGDVMTLPGGTLRYDQLSMWMGYTIFYDPTLAWMFYVSVLGTFGMGWHLWRRTSIEAWKQ